METESEVKGFRSSLRGTFWIASILLILAMLGALVPFIVPHGDKRPIRSKVEMSNLETAINQFRAQYNVFPTSKRVSDSYSNFVSYGISSRLNLPNTEPGNSEIMVILMAMETFPNGEPAKFNQKNMRNPRKIVFFDATIRESTNEAGLGPDGCYRDPWGNPYVISLDVDGDGYCEDAVYSKPEVSVDDGTGQVSVGFRRSRRAEHGRVQWKQNVLIWSMGPDGEADPNIPANEGVNADNILSWE